MIRYRVRKVIELRDSVTGSPVVSSALRIFTSGSLKRLDKGEGLVVLIDDGKDAGIPEKIKISGGMYLEAECTVDEYSSSSSQVCTLWLLPAFGYTVPVGIAAVKGKASPGAQIEIADPTNRESLKLAQDYDPEGTTIRLYHERGIDPMGRWYRAASGGTSTAMFIGSIVDKTPDYTEYMAFEPDGGIALKPSGTVFYPMMRTFADDKGEYLAALPFVAAADTELTMTFSVPAGDTADAGTATEGGSSSAGRKGKGGKKSKAGEGSGQTGGQLREITIKVSPGERLRIDEKEN